MYRLIQMTFALCVVLLPATANAQSTQVDTKETTYKSEIMFSPDEEALYQKRYKISINRSKNSDIYDTMEDVVGARPSRPLPVAKADKRTISETALAKAEAYAADNNSNALIVWRNGKIETEAYFGSTTRTSLLNSFSLAKPISALAVGRAIMLGKIKSLDQPVADFVSEWKNDPLRRKILVRHLLDMRAGFLRQAITAEPDDIMARSFLHPRSDEILIREYPITNEPGTRYEYNNATASMVAILIERATGRRYAEFVGTELLQKIGAQGGQVWLNRKNGLANSGCCTMLPATTYLRLAILTLRDGVWDGRRLLPKSYVANMKQPTAQNAYYGMGVYVAGRYTERRGWANPDLPLPKILHGEPYLAADLYLFDGNLNQVVYVIPSQDLVILRTGGPPPRSSEQEWDNSYLPNLVMRGIIADKRTSMPQPR